MEALIKKILPAFVITFTIFSLTNNCISQQTFDALTDCPDIPIEETYLPDIGSLLKPHRTDKSRTVSAPPEARLNVLIVFVQFSNESIESSEWPIGDTPIYIHDLLAELKDTVGNYWDRYDENTEILSDWYQEVSKGIMHVTGNAYNIKLDHTNSYYNTNGVAVMNNEIYQKLENLGSINWHDYDLWSKYPHGDSLSYFERDGYIDMIYKIHRHQAGTTNLFDGQGGFAYLKGNLYRIVLGPNDTLKIDPDPGYTGSGLTIFGTAEGPVTKLFAFNVGRHEYGHYLLGSHRNCGIMGQGDAFLNPWESIKLGYQSKVVVNYSTPNYGIYDYSSRGSNGEILHVPIKNDTTEFFLIANRRKVSRYDVMMYGDTAKGDPFQDVGNYGKGVYIYHIVGTFGLGGYSYSSLMDQECADGLYNWSQTGYDAPDWDPTNYWLPVLKPTDVSYSNEVTCIDGCSVTLNNCDERNVRGISTEPSIQRKWFSIGASPNSDRMYTNETSNWTSRAKDGDRYDVWNVGYNEIFSPYSSPSTKTWNDSNSGIFIWYYNFTGDSPPNLASFKIYRSGEGGFSEDSILHLTPPSRPMGLEISEVIPLNSLHCHPKLTWKHNLEPDMLRTNNTKRYKIFRATESSMGSVPSSYSNIATVDISYSSSPTYTDTWTELYNCTNLEIEEDEAYPVRYYVIAVDKYNFESVPSDFVQETGIPYGLVEDNMTAEENSNIPKEHSLRQNYPNPFNPSTNIQYDLPKDDFVTIKIYDLLGREVLTLVNEAKQAGSYIISFNASNLSSGIYYYKIKAGTFEQVRKMILLK